MGPQGPTRPGPPCFPLPSCMPRSCDAAIFACSFLCKFPHKLLHCLLSVRLDRTGLSAVKFSKQPRFLESNVPVWIGFVKERLSILSFRGDNFFQGLLACDYILPALKYLDARRHNLNRRALINCVS